MACSDPLRPRERLLVHGGASVSTAELIALLLGSGMRGCSAVVLADQLLARAGGLVELAQAPPQELITLSGIGLARATRVVAAFQLGRRVLEVATDEPPRISRPEQVFRRYRSAWAGLAQEVFTVLALDARNGLVGEIEVARGGLTSVDVHPREVFRPLIRCAAASGVLVHNHPSGDPSPSANDIALTGRLGQVGELVGIPILDHIIIGAQTYVSLGEHLGAL